MHPRIRLMLLVIVVGLVLPPAVASGEPARAITHTIRPGDTLYAIAREHGLTVEAIVDANDIPDPDLIVAGDTLTIPVPPAPEPAPDTDASADPWANPEPIPVVDPEAAGRLPSRWHRVVAGDTLAGLARTYGVAVDTIMTVNAMDSDLLRRGMQISLTPVAPPPAGAVRTHTVVKGDTLATIAAAWGTTVDALAEQNGLSDPNLIVIGQQLSQPGWRCPVDGGTWVDDFGYTKPSGRVHEGIDIHAPAGTPVIAPVGGVVRQIEGGMGGLQSWLEGDDGVTYIASHLDAFRAPTGKVHAGAVLGTVGTSGNAARTAPHVHFEMHPSKAGPVSPLRHLETAC